MRPTPTVQHQRKHPRTLVGAMLACLGAAAITIGSTGATATASEGFAIDLFTVVRTDPGTETSLGSWEVPDELQGRSCVATSTPENNSSIHPGNNLRIVSTTTVTLVDVEGSGSPVTSVDQITLGNQVEVILVMGPDGVYSAGLAVTFDCPPPPTTTTSTTVADTTTTTSVLVEDTSTTVADTSTTVADTSTTVLVGNNPPTRSDTTTTVASAAPTTAGTAGNSPTTVATQLPRTGSADTMPVLGALLLGVGSVMLLSARRKHEPA